MKITKKQLEFLDTLAAAIGSRKNVNFDSAFNESVQGLISAGVVEASHVESYLKMRVIKAKISEAVATQRTLERQLKDLESALIDNTPGYSAVSTSSDPCGRPVRRTSSC